MFRGHDLKGLICTFVVLLIFISSASFAQVPEQAEILNRMGNDYCEKGEFEKAVKAYEEAIKVYPEYVDAYYNIGVTYYHDLKDYQQAANYFQKFLELEPDSPDAKSIQDWMAAIESKHGIKPQPILAEKKVIEKKAEQAKPIVSPTPPIPKESPAPLPETPKKKIAAVPTPPVTTPPPSLPIPLPNVPVPEKQIEKPREEAEESKEVVYKKALTYKDRGNLYSGEGKYQMAIREYLKAIELKPDYTDALYNIAKTYDFDLNNNEKAIQYYEEFLKYEPQNSRDAREVKTWLTKAKMDLASSKEAPVKEELPKEVISETTVSKKMEVPKVSARYETKPFMKGLLEKPVKVAAMPQKSVVPEVPKTIAPPLPVAPPAPKASPPPLAPAEESTLLKSYIPKDLKSVQNSILLRAEMRNELLDIFKSKNSPQAERLAQLFLTKIKQRPFTNRYEIAQIEIPGDLLANIKNVYILKHGDRIRLNSEKGDLLRSPQTVQSKKRLQEITQILDDGYEIRR